MKTVKVRIEGISPLLQHRFPEEANPENKSKKKIKEYIAQIDCETALYKDEKGNIYQPSTHIFGCLIKAGSRFNFEKKQTYSSIIKSSLIVLPEAIPHIYKEWEIDRRNVVIQRARIMRARPRFNKWALEFKIEFDDELIGKDKLKEILDFAGQRIGIGDYQQRHTLWWGRF